MSEFTTGDEFLDDQVGMFLHYSTTEECEVQDSLQLSGLTFAVLLDDWYRAGHDKRLSAVGWITMELDDFVKANQAAVNAIWTVNPRVAFHQWWFSGLSLYKWQARAN